MVVPVAGRIILTGLFAVNKATFSPPSATGVMLTLYEAEEFKGEGVMLKKYQQ